MESLDEISHLHPLNDNNPPSDDHGPVPGPLPVRASTFPSPTAVTSPRPGSSSNKTMNPTDKVALQSDLGGSSGGPGSGDGPKNGNFRTPLAQVKRSRTWAPNNGGIVQPLPEPLREGEIEGDGDGGKPWKAQKAVPSSSSSAAGRARGLADEHEHGEADDGVMRMHKFNLYETSARFYLVGMDLEERRFRVLKIERTSKEEELSISEDDTIYSMTEIEQLLEAVADGNKSSGGLRLRCICWGVLGFIRFIGPYYMLVVTKKSQVAMLGGHYIFQIDDTELIPLIPTAAAKLKSEQAADESRYVAILNNLDLTKSSYFSYSYDITRTLQLNMALYREAVQQDTPIRCQNYNQMFVWNYHILQPASSLLKHPYDWCIPIIHGYVDQSSIYVYGRIIYVTLIARRSRHFAGARYLKRGANDRGHVANDVESEQIVSEMLTTSFHSPGPKLYANPQYTSYVQHRGSIPLHWTQDSSGVNPKPDIEMSLVDPFYTAAALHFDNLFERYGTPIYVLNLVKAKERTPRESKLLKEFTDLVVYLNQFLPEDKKIIHNAFDMSRAAKSRDQDVIQLLEDIADDVLPLTGFFRNGEDKENGLQLQNGIARTNCIDCLDRTNAAQFVIAKNALGRQLNALGVIKATTLEYDTDAINILHNMWHHHGDSIAIQYGGSQLVNTMSTYRKINQWTGHSRDMVESFKRYYNNSFLDAQRQEAYNLFLGNYVVRPGQPMLWDLESDTHLHHSDPRERVDKNYDYINWFTPEFLKQREMPPTQLVLSIPSENPITRFDDYWTEYYRPRTPSILGKVFSFRMKSTLGSLPYHGPACILDESPFSVRTIESDSSRERRSTPSLRPSSKNRIKIQEPPKPNRHRPAPYHSSLSDSTIAEHPLVHTAMGIERFDDNLPSLLKEESSQIDLVPSPTESRYHPYDNNHNTARASQSSHVLGLDSLVASSLAPSVSTSEAEEYARYVHHPLRVPLVATSDHEAAAVASLAEAEGRGGAAAAMDVDMDLVEYVGKITLEESRLEAVAEESLSDYEDFLRVDEQGLTVEPEDLYLKRYKRYRQWLRGKSLFKVRADG